MQCQGGCWLHIVTGWVVYVQTSNPVHISLSWFPWVAPGERWNGTLRMALTATFPSPSIKMINTKPIFLITNITFSIFSQISQDQIHSELIHIHSFQFRKKYFCFGEVHGHSLSLNAYSTEILIFAMMMIGFWSWALVFAPREYISACLNCQKLRLFWNIVHFF